MEASIVSGILTYENDIPVVDSEFGIHIHGTVDPIHVNEGLGGISCWDITEGYTGSYVWAELPGLSETIDTTLNAGSFDTNTKPTGLRTIRCGIWEDLSPNHDGTGMGIEQYVDIQVIYYGMRWTGGSDLMSGTIDAYTFEGLVPCEISNLPAVNDGHVYIYSDSDYINNLPAKLILDIDTNQTTVSFSIGLSDIGWVGHRTLTAVCGEEQAITSVEITWTGPGSERGGGFNQGVIANSLYNEVEYAGIVDLTIEDLQDNGVITFRSTASINTFAIIDMQGSGTITIGKGISQIDVLKYKEFEDAVSVTIRSASIITVERLKTFNSSSTISISTGADPVIRTRGFIASSTISVDSTSQLIVPKTHEFSSTSEINIDSISRISKVGEISRIDFEKETSTLAISNETSYTKFKSYGQGLQEDSKIIYTLQITIDSLYDLIRAKGVKTNYRVNNGELEEIEIISPWIYSRLVNLLQDVTGKKIRAVSTDNRNGSSIIVTKEEL